MTTKPTRKQPPAKLPKGRVMYTYNPTDDGTAFWRKQEANFQEPVAVLPATSTKQARRTLKAGKFLGMTMEEQVEAVKSATAVGLLGHGAMPSDDYTSNSKYEAIARAVLALIYGEGGK